MLYLTTSIPVPTMNEVTLVFTAFVVWCLVCSVMAVVMKIMRRGRTPPSW